MKKIKIETGSAIDIGRRLRGEREKRGISLDEVRTRLRIHTKILTELEGNQFDELPAPIYSRGFLKQYAEFLGLNAALILSQYDALNIKPREQIFNIKPKVAPKKTFAEMPVVEWIGRYKIAIIKFIFAFIAVLILWNLVSGLAHWLSQREPAPSPVVSRAPVVTPPPERAIDYLSSPLRSDFPEILPGTQLTLLVEASADAWMRVTGDGQILFQAILGKGSSRTWLANDQIQIKVGRPKAIRMTLNEFILPRPGRGQITHFRISRDGIQEVK